MRNYIGGDRVRTVRIEVSKLGYKTINAIQCVSQYGGQNGCNRFLIVLAPTAP